MKKIKKTKRIENHMITACEGREGKESKTQKDRDK